MAQRKKPAARKKKPVDLYALGARVVSVFGPFASRVLIEMPLDKAAEMFPQPVAVSGRSSLVEGVERDLALLAKRDSDVSKTALAATALALAYEIEHPYNSATSKAMCARSLLDTLERLRESVPEKQEANKLDDLSAKRTARRKRSATA